jgi:hypothetical protein
MPNLTPGEKGTNVGYVLDLDEFDESDLRAELSRRSSLRKRGLCDYCERSSKSSPCKFPERHNKPLLKKKTEEERWKKSKDRDNLLFHRRVSKMTDQELISVFRSSRIGSGRLAQVSKEIIKRKL